MALQDDIEAVMTPWVSGKVSRADVQSAYQNILFGISEPTLPDLDCLYEAAAGDGHIQEMWVEWLNTMCFAEPKDLVTIFGGSVSSDYREPPVKNLSGAQKVAIIDWLAQRDLVDKSKYCKHENIRVDFDEEAARGLDAWEVRKRWPRYSGPCPDCGGHMISYASFLHYVSGDW